MRRRTTRDLRLSPRGRCLHVLRDDLFRVSCQGDRMTGETMGNWLTEQFERSAKHLLSVDPALLSPVGRDLRRQLERRKGRHLRLVK